MEDSSTPPIDPRPFGFSSSLRDELLLSVPIDLPFSAGKLSTPFIFDFEVYSCLGFDYSDLCFEPCLDL